MDREQVKRWEAQCIEEQAPACTAACPLHVDARALAVAVAAGDFQKGLSLLAVSVPLPRILAHICDQPCRAACRRAEAGDPIQVGLLERVCAVFGGAVPAPRKQPASSKRIAVVGGGLSGVAAAIRLAVRGYPVSLFEVRSLLLERWRSLPEDRLPASILDGELAVLEHLSVVVHCGVMISRHSAPFGIDALVTDFDAVFLATGPELFDEDSLQLERTPEGRLRIDPLTLATSLPGLFAGGSQRCRSIADSPVRSIADGVHAAVSIDRFLQGASLTANRDDQGPYPSRLYVNTQGIVPSPAVPLPPESHAYSRELAIQEAGRCFPCHCLECVKVCPYLEEYGSHPKSYVRQIYNNECIVMGVRKANRMINSCALCGLCAQVCPEHLNMADVCLDARQGMVRSGKMPPSAHDFALRDMAFSQSDAFTLARHQPGSTASQAAFLPGCQLSASSPDHVVSVYKHLCATLPGGVGLLLGCCGAPARWAGNETKYQEAVGSMQAAWDSLGQPRLITACSSCFKSIRDALPQIPIEPLWPHIRLDRVPNAPSHSGRRLALHDPCSTRGVSAVEDSARAMLTQLGVEVEELNPAGLTTCCGYGGLMLFANPPVASKTVQKRMAQSTADYVTYCAMCRDRFAHEGKPAIHILDLVFGHDPAGAAARPDPGFSRRQDNRTRLKQKLLHEVWGEGETSMEPARILHMADALRPLLEERLILERDIRQTIDAAEQNCDWIDEPATGHRFASLRVACVTYWVEYSVSAGTTTVHDAYSHRMEVR